MAGRKNVYNGRGGSKDVQLGGETSGQTWSYVRMVWRWQCGTASADLGASFQVWASRPWTRSWQR